MNINKEKVFLFGASTLGVEAYKFLKNKYSILGFIDNDKSKLGSSIDDLPIIPPSNLVRNDDYKIIITSSYYLSIICQLLNFGIYTFYLYTRDNSINDYCLINMKYQRGYINANNIDYKECSRKEVILYKLNISELIDIKLKLPINIEHINCENYTQVSKLREKSVSIHFKNMLEKHQLGIFAIDNEAPIGHAWGIVNTNLSAVNNMFIMKENTAMIHFCYVAQERRGKNVYAYLLSSLIKQIQDECGIKEFYIFTDCNNIESQKGLSKVGFKKVQEIRFYFYNGVCLNMKTI